MYYIIAFKFEDRRLMSLIVVNKSNLFGLGLIIYLVHNNKGITIYLLFIGYVQWL